MTDYRWSIFQFPGGETERAKPLATRDFGPVFQEALESGEKVDVPAFDYPIRSLNGSSSTHGVEVSGVDIDVECAARAKIIAGEIFWGAAHNVFQLVGAFPLSPEGLDTAVTLKWRGGTASGRQLTDDHGTGSGFGNALMNVVGFAAPHVEGIFFDGGTVAPSFNLVGAGAIDTLLGWNQNVGGHVKGCRFLGAYDLAIYGIGYRINPTLATNPITSGAAGSAVVTVAAPAHGMRNGDRCHLKGVTAFNGLTIADGEYAVSGAAANTFQVSASSGVASASGVSGGGAAVVFTNSRSNKRATSIIGESSLFEGNWLARNNNAIGVKRNLRNLKIIGNTFRENGNDISSSGVGEYEGGDGKRLVIAHNDHFFTQSRPIWLQGGGPETIVAENTIENWGRQLYDGGATAINISSGAPLSAIQIDSMDAAQIRHNSIRMTDVFAGASWIAGEEPAAIRLDRNADYKDGCVDCVVDGNTIIDVPQPFNDGSSNLRTRIGNGNFVRGATKASVYASNGVSISANKALVSGNMSLAATGVVVATIAHGLDFAPAAGNCVASIGTTTTNGFALAWGPRVVSADATNIIVAIKVETAAAGQTLTVNVHIR